MKKKVEELDLKVTAVDAGLTIVKEKSLSDMPLIQITPSASGYSCDNVISHETSLDKSVHLQGSLGPTELVSGKLYPPWSYKMP